MIAREGYRDCRLLRVRGDLRGRRLLSAHRPDLSLDSDERPPLHPQASAYAGTNRRSRKLFAGYIYRLLPNAGSFQPEGVLAQMAGYDALGYASDPCPYLYNLM